MGYIVILMSFQTISSINYDYSNTITNNLQHSGVLGRNAKLGVYFTSGASVALKLLFQVSHGFIWETYSTMVENLGKGMSLSSLEC